MAEQEGPRWDVSIKGNAVLVERISEKDERIFDDTLAPEEARKLADLLTRFADKADDGESEHGDSEDGESEDGGESKDPES